MLTSDAAASLRGFGPLGIAAMLVILFTGNVIVGRVMVLPVGALIVLVWVWQSGTPWREIGDVRPRSWIGSLAAGLAVGGGLKILVKTSVMPLLGADAINPTYAFLVGNRDLLPAAALAMVIAGFAEETTYRGFLFERLGKLFGSGLGAKAAIVLLTSAGFATAHYPDQGLAGVEQAAITGLTFGSMFAVSGRIVAPMCAHAAYDLTALAIIYWNLESTVAHLIFK